MPIALGFTIDRRIHGGLNGFIEDNSFCRSTISPRGDGAGDGSKLMERPHEPGNNHL